MSAGPELSQLSHAQKDALIATLMAELAATKARLAELEAKLGLPPKTPDNSSIPPSKGITGLRGFTVTVLYSPIAHARPGSLLPRYEKALR